MTIENKTKFAKSEDYIEVTINSAALALSMCFSAAICAPLLPAHLKEKIHDVSGLDFNTAHNRLKEMGLRFMESVGHAADHLTGEKQTDHEQADKRRKAPEKSFHFGKWVFTIPSQK